jgi:hypothetical protein
MGSDSQILAGAARDDSGDLVVYAQKVKAVQFVAVVLLLGGISGSVLFFVASARGLVAQTCVVALTLLLCATVASQGLASALSSRPRLIVSHQGIAIAPSPSNTRLIHWQEIRELRLYRSELQGALTIHLTSPDALFADSQDPLWRRLGGLSRAGLLLTGHVILTDAMLASTIPDLVAEIRARFGTELVRYNIRVRFGN